MSFPSPLSLLLFAALASCRNDIPFNPPAGAGSPLRPTTLVTGLDTPWDIEIDPDGALWITERRGVISRADTSSGALTRVGTVAARESGESGLMGLALHPAFPSQPLVYVAYSYDDGGPIRNRLSRLRWNGSSLEGETILLQGIAGASIHDGSRLAFGPDGYLYMTTGDASNTSTPQDPASLSGKVLRLTADGEPAPGNPFGHAWSLGHRNPQGMVFHGQTGALYITEHGPSTDDEVNLITGGANYGWPLIHGLCDGNVSGEEAACSSLDETPPLAVWTPTIAPAGADVYLHSLIPGWRGNLLFVTLKGQSLRRLVLSADGKGVASQESLFRGDFGRLRDVLVGPRGELYLATSNRDGRGSPATDDDRIIRLVP